MQYRLVGEEDPANDGAYVKFGGKADLVSRIFPRAQPHHIVDEI